MEPTPIDIGATIAYGVMFDPKNGERIRQMDLSTLFDSVGRLFDLLDERDIDYVVAGGIAMLAYVEGRNTQNIDLLLSREAVAKLPELVVEDENNDFLRARFGELQVDVLLTAKNLFSQVASNHSELKVFADRKVRCATPAGLSLLKLYALPLLYRQGNLSKVRIYERDIEELLATFELDSDTLLELLRDELLESDLQELGSILADLQARLEAEKRRFKKF